LRALSSIILAASLLMVGGCAFNEKANVTYIEAVRTVSTLPNPDQTVHIFVDRNGDLYPPSKAGFTREGMEASHDHSTSEDYSSLWRYANNPNHRNQVISHINQEMPAAQVCIDGTMQECWRGYQKHLKAQTAFKLQELLSRHPCRRMVILLHGYNNDYSDAANWYDSVSSDINRRYPGTLFVRVHWDGLGQSIPVGIWGNAQSNGPLAGVGLRYVFNWVNNRKLDRETVVITHSTGALVAAAMLGDSSAPLPGMADVLNSKHPLPRADRFRVGLLIPAAAANTFNNYLATKSIGADAPSSRTPSRLVLGLNKKDGPTNKYFLSCRASGDTCMNTDARAACRNISSAFSQVEDFENRFKIYEFSTDSTGKPNSGSLWEDHSVTSQMTRPKWGSFIDALMSDDPAPPDDSKTVCSR